VFCSSVFWELLFEGVCSEECVLTKSVSSKGVCSRGVWNDDVCMS
jgi:hypothetical protein